MKIITNTVLLCLIIWFALVALNTSGDGSTECKADEWDDLTCCITRSEHCCTTADGGYPYPEVNVCLKDSQDEKLIESSKLDISLFEGLEQWSTWANLGGCSVSCGEGKQFWTRNRFLPFAQINQTDIEEFPCNQTQCPGLEQWSTWANLGGCSVSCGEGKQYWTRNRFLPFAQINQTDIGEFPCNQTQCPVDLEQWSEWDNLGGCSVTCGQGIQHQTRNRFLSSAQRNETDIGEKECDQTKCPVFKWDHLNEKNLTFEEKKEMMKHELVEIKANLTVDKKNTSSAIRRRTSAPDHRHSASSFGYAGIILLVLPLVLLVCADCIRCCQPKQISRKKRICLSKRETGVELTVMELET